MQRAVLHALELAVEDVERWCLRLPPALLAREPMGLPSVAFQVRHIARSVDRLLTYAEGGALTEAQLSALARERSGIMEPRVLREEFESELARGMERVRACRESQLGDVRFVGRERLPTTVAGLLVHVAEHTQRHVGQAITTAKVLHALGNNEAH